MRPCYGAALDVDARPAFIFESGEGGLWAVTLDGSGANLPARTGSGAWLPRGEFALGVQEPVPLPIDPEPILRGIAAQGYFLWREANTSNPHGTSQ